MSQPSEMGAECGTQLYRDLGKLDKEILYALLIFL